MWISIGFLFFLSGFTGLLYEVVWVRLFGLVFGNTTLAAASVLAAFMLGMALGGLLIGSRADRLGDPLRMFAWLEFGIAITAPLVLVSRPALEWVLAPIYGHWPGNSFAAYGLKSLLAFVIMLPATFLMGGTLPVLSKALVGEKEKAGEGIGVLYGVNTLGGVVGCLLTGFLLIRSLGVSSSILLAVTLNLLVAALAFLLSWRSGTEMASMTAQRRRGALLADPRARQIAFVMAVSGFAALGYEVIWGRILVFVFTNSVYAFTVMLTTFLLGIAAGSFFGGLFIDRLSRLPRWLGWVEVAIGTTALLSGFLLANLNAIHRAVFPIDPGTTWLEWNAIRFTEAFLVMFLPTFLMGISFPLASKIIVAVLEFVGEAVGSLYFFNTVGGMLGSLLTGLVLLRSFGAAATLVMLILSNLGIGIWLLMHHKLAGSVRKAFAYFAVVLALMAVTVQAVPAGVFSGIYSIVEEGFRIIDYREGIEGTVTVHQSDFPMKRDRRLDVDGLNVAGTSFMLRTLQTLQGHLPNLVHGPARNVLQIGFGTGQTSRSALMYPIERLTVVEISQDVMELAAKHFSDINGDVTRDPRFLCVISDGKNFLKYTPEKFDIIMNDANYAVATASASLFTRDHFVNCRNKLKPGGIFSTWMTTDLDPEDFAIVLKTFHSVFPYGLLFMAPNCINKQVVLIGSTEPIRLDVAWMEEQLRRESVKADLAAINIQSVFDLLSCVVLDSDGIGRISGRADISTDDRPILEFSRKAVRSRDLCALQNLARILRFRPALRNLVANVPDSGNFWNSLLRYEAASLELFRGLVVFYQGNVQEALETLLSGSRIIPESRLAEEYFRHMDAVVAQLSYEAQQNPQKLEPWLKLLRYRIATRQFEIALRMCQELTAKFGETPLLLYEMARVHFALSQFEKARSELMRALELKPELSGAWYLLGVVEKHSGQFEGARRSLLRALQLDGRMYEAYNALAGIEMSQGELRQAIGHLQKSLQLMDFQPQIWANLGECYFGLQEYANAVRGYEYAIYQGLDSPDLYAKLAYSYYFLRDFARAESYLNEAIRLDSDNSEYYYNLGNVLVNRGNLSAAAEAYRHAIGLSRDHPDYFNNLALCYRQMGDSVAAERVIREGLKYHPQSELLSRSLRFIRGSME
jgi:spermidine synthase